MISLGIWIAMSVAVLLLLVISSLLATWALVNRQSAKGYEREYERLLQVEHERLGQISDLHEAVTRMEEERDIARKQADEIRELFETAGIPRLEQDESQP